MKVKCPGRDDQQKSELLFLNSAFEPGSQHLSDKESLKALPLAAKVLDDSPDFANQPAVRLPTPPGLKQRKEVFALKIFLKSLKYYASDILFK